MDCLTLKVRNDFLFVASWGRTLGVDRKNSQSANAKASQPIETSFLAQHTLTSGIGIKRKNTNGYDQRASPHLKENETQQDQKTSRSWRQSRLYRSFQQPIWPAILDSIS